MNMKMKLDDHELYRNQVMLDGSWSRLRRFKELKAPLFIIKMEQCVLWRRRYAKLHGVFPDAARYERLKYKYQQRYTMQ